jgi:hypothetical protein
MSWLTQRRLLLGSLLNKELRHLRLNAFCQWCAYAPIGTPVKCSTEGKRCCTQSDSFDHASPC